MAMQPQSSSPATPPPARFATITTPQLIADLRRLNRRLAVANRELTRSQEELRQTITQVQSEVAQVEDTVAEEGPDGA